MKGYAAAIFTAAAAWIAYAGVVNAGVAGTSRSALQFGGLRRSYLLHVPAGSSGDRAMPLVLVLHGGGGTASGTEPFTGFSVLADRRGFFAVYPDAIRRSWNDGRDVESIRSQHEGIDDAGFIAALIDDVASRYRIDRQRIYATGISNGAFFSNYLAARLSERIAAIAPVAGGIAEPLAPRFHPATPVSVLIIQSTDDPLVPFEGGNVARDRGRVIPTRDTLRLWTEADGCPGPPAVTEMAVVDPKDPTRVSETGYAGCREGTEVVLYTVRGAGHTWPGGPQYLPAFLIGKTSHQFNATDVIWSFFEAHPKRTKGSPGD